MADRYRGQSRDHLAGYSESPETKPEALAEVDFKPNYLGLVEGFGCSAFHTQALSSIETWVDYWVDAKSMRLTSASTGGG